MSAEIPRPEHPRPHFFRKEWLNLNGLWDFTIDTGKSGLERGWPENPKALTQKIQVPFCPESKLSGIHHTDFMDAVWYHRRVEIPKEWGNGRLRLHIGAADYRCTLWVNGRKVGVHEGGGVSFHFEIGDYLEDDSNSIVILVEDDARSGKRPQGKQCPEFASRRCHYMRTTGIWQTVWLEALPKSSIERVNVTSLTNLSGFCLAPFFRGAQASQLFRVRVFADSECVAEASVSPNGHESLFLQISNPRVWSPDDPFLYELLYELLDEAGEIVDSVQSYAGLRTVYIERNQLFLNNKPLFMRFVLDQGFYPQGVWTAPSDEALKNDILLAQKLGFNGARLHQKVFEERFHYWADRLGYLTFGEFYDWGLDFSDAQALLAHHREWTEVLERDSIHPSIIAWTPFNETITAAKQVPHQHQQAVAYIMRLTHLLDPSRPCHSVSGFVQVETDIFSVHDYEQDPTVFGAKLASIASPHAEQVYRCFPDLAEPYSGQPYFIGEYGGTWWDVELAKTHDAERKTSWGYGERPQSIEEVYERIEGLTGVILEQPGIAGFCYTQLTDVEQERNGLLTYDRKPKFDVPRLRACFTGK